MENQADIPVDPNEVVRRAARYDPHLIQRVVAEIQRDTFAQMLEQEKAPKPLPPTELPEQEESA